jgi:hypothetical protein
MEEKCMKKGKGDEEKEWDIKVRKKIFSPRVNLRILRFFRGSSQSIQENAEVVLWSIHSCFVPHAFQIIKISLLIISCQIKFICYSIGLPNTNIL